MPTDPMVIGSSPNLLLHSLVARMVTRSMHLQVCRVVQPHREKGPG